MWEGNKSPILGLRSKRRVHIVVVDNLASIVLASQKWKMFVVNFFPMIVTVFYIVLEMQLHHLHQM